MSRPPRGAEGGFLDRWSRLKRESAEAPEPVEVAPAPAPAPETPSEPEPDKTDAEILEELGLPEPESLQPGDDFSAFMGRAVPEHLRRRALRRLWLANPALANLDELLDYGDDFTDAATVIENLQTVYRVGRGMLPDPELEPGQETAHADAPAGAEEGAAADDPRETEAPHAGQPGAEEPGQGGPGAPPPTADRPGAGTPPPDETAIAAAAPAPRTLAPEPAVVSRPRMRFRTGAG
ncbi:MAG: DUF3306 domain-containing protein [Pseudomonadota bacterium]